MKKVNEVCKIAGISKRTLQYYDDEGILLAERSEGNERLYDDDALKKLMHLLTYKKLGLTLEQIKETFDAPTETKNEIMEEHIKKLVRKRTNLENQVRLTRYIVEKGMPELKR